MNGTEFFFQSKEMKVSAYEATISFYFSSGSVLQPGTYGGGMGPIWMDDVRCTGTETSIMNCTRKPWGVNDCQHIEDVAVSCSREFLSFHEV